MSTHQEQDMRRDLAELSAAYRQASEEADTPSAALDARILAAARDKAQKLAPATTPSRFKRWQTPMSAAALVLITSVIVLVNVHERPDSVSESSANLAQAPVLTEDTAQASRSESAQTVVSASLAKELEAKAQPASAAARTKRSARTAPAPEPTLNASVEQNEKPVTRNLDSQAEQVVSAQDGKSKDLVVSDAKKASAHISELSEQRREPTGMRVESAKASPPAPPAPTAIVAEKRSATLDPQTWIEQIAQLQAQGKTSQAREALEKFRQQYPHYAVPENLLKALEVPQK